MSGCTATLTTATVEPCPDPANGCDADECYGRIGSPLHVTLHTLTCDTLTCDRSGTYIGSHGAALDNGVEVEWTDGTPGAQPHRPPDVTDDEYHAAYMAVEGHRLSEREVRRMLEAAARVRRGDDQ